MKAAKLLLRRDFRASMERQAMLPDASTDAHASCVALQQSCGHS